MNNYEKPIVVKNEEIAEGVYAASGNGTPGCDSRYMNGVYVYPSYGWDNPMKEHYGCLGCPAYRATGCGLLVDQAYLDGALSYDTDNGKRKPNWESMGYTDTTIVNDQTHF